MYEHIDDWLIETCQQIPEILYVAPSGFASYWDTRFCWKLLHSLKRIVRNNTLILPAFSFDFCDKGIYSTESSSSFCGVVCELFRMSDDVKRIKYSPIHSVSIFGSLSNYFYDRRYSSSFGDNSIFQELNNYNCGVLLIDCSFDDGIPFVHCLEEKFHSTYCEYKPYQGIIITKENKVIDYLFIRCMKKKNIKISTLHIFRGFYNSDKVRSVKYEKSDSTFFFLNDFYRYFEPIFKKDPNVLKVA